MNRFRIVLVLLLCLSAGWAQGPPAARQDHGAKIWVGRYQEFEESLRAAECVSMENFGPNRARCTLRMGGPFARLLWKSFPPGLHRGFWESYKGEIAAYQVDKLLKMDMVPPTIERELDGTTGVAQLWVENILPVKADESPGESQRADWDIQIVRMRMFDNLIGNKDRNLGNMLRDAAWHLIVVDHIRAFGTGSDLPHKLMRIDEDFWRRIDGLTRDQVVRSLRAELDDKQIDALLDRRERMRADVKSLPK